MVCAPPKMADGRILTDYRSASLIDIQMQSKVKTPNQYSYRQYLIENGNKISAQQRQDAKFRLVTGKHSKQKTAKKVPERYMTICQGNRCEIREINPNGIGIGREATTTWTPLQANDSFLKTFDTKSGPSLYKTVQ